MSLGLSSVNIIKTVDRSAIDAVKDQIFNNAQQKAALVAKNDVMNDARAEFRQKTNPFSFDISAANKDSSSSSFASYSNDSQNSKGKEDVKKITLKHKVNLENELQTQSIQESIMLQARKQIGGSADLMSKLNFLQTQTAISTYSARA
ncbi:hypothetical protein IJ818_06935 [bacterium]|nr:hypothetical protein [bacterium]